MHIILIALKSVFSILMLIDAIQRGRQQIWYIIILIPFGEVAYFFAVYLPESGLQAKIEKFFTKPISLDQHAYNAKITPSTSNLFSYAKALHDHGEVQKAITILEPMIDKTAPEKEVLYGLACCYSSAKQSAKAIETFKTLIGMDFGYKDYDACWCLVDEYWQQGAKDKAVDLARKVVLQTKRIEHSATLAEYLVQCGLQKEAKNLLDEVLLDYKNSPRWVQRNNRASKRRAQKLLASIDHQF